MLVFVCLIAIFHTPSALGGYVECFVNGGFEQGFEGWFNQGAGIDDTTAHSGNKSATVAYSQFCSQYFDPAIPSWLVVSFTFWVKRAEGSGNSLGISVEFNETDWRGRLDAYTAISQYDVPADGQWHLINLTDWLLEVSESRGITRIVFGCGSYNWLQWWVDDFSLLLYMEEPSNENGENGGIPIPWPPPPYKPPTPPEGESGGEGIGGVINEWLRQFAESVRLAWQRLTGNPAILLLLLLMVLALGYYALRRR